LVFQAIGTEEAIRIGVPFMQPTDPFIQLLLLSIEVRQVMLLVILILIVGRGVLIWVLEDILAIPILLLLQLVQLLGDL
jgi:hypothetical protein